MWPSGVIATILGLGLRCRIHGLNQHWSDRAFCQNALLNDEMVRRYVLSLPGLAEGSTVEIVMDIIVPVLLLLNNTWKRLLEFVTASRCIDNLHVHVAQKPISRQARWCSLVFP